jgi:D-amino peptidase
VRIYISVDMEGASGVTRWQDVVTTGQDYQRARSWMTADVNAAVAGARAAGATEFVVEENHGVEMLCNLVLDELDPDVDVVRGLPRGGPTTAAALDDSFDAMFLVAHHAKVGDYPGYCAHTISYGEYDDVRLDGRTIGEGEIFATIAAQHGVPTALVTGDDVIAAEMAKITPGIEAAIVKRAMSRTGGWIVPPKRAAVIIAEAASWAVDKVRTHQIPVIDVEPPYAMEIDLRRPFTDEARAAFARFPAYELVGERTVRFQQDDMAIAYRMAAVAGPIANGENVRSY